MSDSHPPAFAPPARLTRRRIPGLIPAVLLGTLLGASACQSAPQEDELDEPSPYAPSSDTKPETIGYFLTQYDKSLQRWNELKLNAKGKREIRALNALERNMTRRAKDREGDLIVELEVGPPANREVAAVALGFTENPANLSPLVAALSDPVEPVVQKALLGIGVLANPDTPTAQITYLLLQHPDPWTRNNAAYALTCIVANGSRPEGLADDCRDALVDEEPGVRAQVACVLGMLEDPLSVPILTDLLHDDVRLVFSASATALATIGRGVDSEKGNCARALADALDRVDDSRRERVLEELMRLSERNLGEETEEWLEWAYKMP
jgi:hypothetical protein